MSLQNGEILTPELKDKLKLEEITDFDSKLKRGDIMLYENDAIELINGFADRTPNYIKANYGYKNVKFYKKPTEKLEIPKNYEEIKGHTKIQWNDKFWNGKSWTQYYNYKPNAMPNDYVDNYHYVFIRRLPLTPREEAIEFIEEKIKCDATPELIERFEKAIQRGDNYGL